VSLTHIPAPMRCDVIARANGRCEYCGVPDDATLAPHEPHHISGEQHGGATELNNLAYACFRCNRFKGPNIAARDPETRLATALFNPRTDQWDEHFRLNGAVVGPLLAIRRGTTLLLRLNDEQRVALRAELLRQGNYSPPV
jgi:HNH endonuclease